MSPGYQSNASSGSPSSPSTASMDAPTIRGTSTIMYSCAAPVATCTAVAAGAGVALPAGASAVDVAADCFRASSRSNSALAASMAAFPSFSPILDRSSLSKIRSDANFTSSPAACTYLVAASVMWACNLAYAAGAPSRFNSARLSASSCRSAEARRPHAVQQFRVARQCLLVIG